MRHVWLVHCGWYAPMGHVWLVHCGWYAPLATLPKGREFLRAVFEVVLWCSFPLGKVGMGPLFAAPSPWEGTEKVPHPLQTAG